jgi:hypothetical protein
MVPQSVQKTWTELPEDKKIAFCRAIAAKQPQVFMAWAQAAALRSFRPNSLMNRKAGSGARLDAALLKKGDEQLTADVMVAYFTTIDTEINDDYLAMLKGAGNEELETRLDIYAKLTAEYTDYPYLQLYLAAALWLGEIDEKELETIEKMAGEMDI